MAKYQARLAAAAKAQPVAETIKQVKKMLETVQTRDDVAFIKKYINRQFSGQLSESADAQRSHLLNEVTRIGALRRRTHSQQLAR
jgi:Fe-S cluster assembly ATPase SufC